MTERPFSDLLRHPKEVTNDVENGDVLLRRRDEPDLRLTRADRFWIIVDLDLLVNDGHALKSRLRKIVIAMEAAGLFHGKDVDIVGTKADMFATDQIETVEQGFREFAADLKGRMGDEGSRANVHMVA